MALWLGKLILASGQHGRSFLSISYFPAMPRNSALQNFPGTSLPRPLFGIGGRHGKHLQFRIRKVDHNFRNSTDQSKNVQLKLDHGCRFLRSLTNEHALGDSASFSLPLRSGALSTRNTKSSLRSFETNGDKSDSLPCEFMDRRLLSVQAMQKVPASMATSKRSKETFVDDIQKQDSNSALKVSSLDGGLQIQDPKLPLEKGSPRNSKSVSKTADVLQRKKKGIQGKKNGHENVDQPSMNNVVSGKSTDDSKGGDSSKYPKAPVEKNQQTRKKKNNNPPSESCQPFGTSEPLISIKTSQGKRCQDASSSQISKTLPNEIDQAGETRLPVVANQASEHFRSTAENSFKKKGAQKKVNAVKSEKIPAKKSNCVVQVLSSGETPSSSTSKAGHASCAAGRVKADNCRVKNWNGTFGPLFPPNGKSVVVVESVTKASVIQKYLGDMFEVLPSYGHVRDLAGRSGSVRPDDDFSMVWEVPASAWTHLKSIKVALKGAKNLILASDPDREGEAIAWHITEMLQQQDAFHEGITVARVTFCEITESAVKRALQCPRDIDKNLVHAYLARRALDYLIGFNISPLLWRKLPGCQSAGRVQSAALALVCEREMEIDKFKQQQYWSVDAQFHRAEDVSVYFKSQVTHYDSKKLDKLSISSEAEANTVQQNITSSNFQVVGAKRSKMQRNPPMPYITSSLQQDAANRLNFYTDYTMKLAQKLYEGVKLSNDEATGLITYVRTDGLHVSDEVVRDIGMLVVERYGQDYILKSNPKYFKVKNAQEAHEAIRPTNIRRLPSSLVGILDEDSLKLYSLIWSRTIACQMEPATVEKVQVDIADDNKSMVLRSTSSRVVFPGYQAVYKDEESAAVGYDENEENAREEAFNVLFSLKLGDQVNLSKVEIKQHHTEPPPRYSEASLVKRLEELGIGRPSTYASILKVLKERNYVTMKSRKLVPEFRGRMVSAFLSRHFSEVTDYSFTADMETELDNVSKGTTEWKGLLKDYWARFSMYCDLTSKIDIRQVEKMLEETYTHYLFASLPDKSRRCPSCNEGTLIFKVSRFGAGYFIGCDKHPKCKYIAKTIFTEDDEGVNPQKPDNSFKPKLLGLHPGSNEKVYVKNGPYGYYVQLGDDSKGYSPKRASILKATNIESVTLEDALELLRYPLTLGNHPHDQEPVLLRISKFGFSVKHRRTIAPVPKGVHPQKVTLERALKYLASKGAKQCGRPKGKPRVEEAMEAMFSQ